MQGRTGVIVVRNTMDLGTEKVFLLYCRVVRIDSRSVMIAAVPLKMSHRMKQRCDVNSLDDGK